jgi:putative ABC transport system ATP-binding protein
MILKIENLCKTYTADGVPTEALKNVSFELEKGTFMAVVGTSGSGKSTLLHMIGGMDRPSGGKVLVNEKDITGYSETELSVFRRREVGFVFQFFNLIPVLDIRENIELPMLLDNKKPDSAYIDELIKMLGLQACASHLPSQLSGGEQQRAAIGRALAYKPSLLLADEPTGNLDSKNRREVVDLLEYSVKRYNQTLILITHDLDIAKRADRVMVLEDGRIVKDEVR